MRASAHYPGRMVTVGQITQLPDILVTYAAAD